MGLAGRPRRGLYINPGEICEKITINRPFECKNVQTQKVDMDIYICCATLTSGFFASKTLGRRPPESVHGVIQTGTIQIILTDEQVLFSLSALKEKADGTKHHRHLASALLNPELPVERAFCDSAFRSRESVHSIGVWFPSVWLSLDLAIFGDIPAPLPFDLYVLYPITPLNPIGLIECNAV